MNLILSIFEGPLNKGFSKMEKEVKGISVLDAAEFQKQYLSSDQLTLFFKALPPIKVGEFGILVNKMSEGERLTVQPVKRISQNGAYGYNTIDLKTRNGNIPFFVPYNPQIERFILDYLSGRIKIAFKLEEVYDVTK